VSRTLSLLPAPGVPILERDAVSHTEPADSLGSVQAALVRLYDGHYAELVRVAVLLVRDRETAEDVVQDAYVQLCRRWDRLEDPGEAVGYLRTSVLNGARSALRRRGVARRHQAEGVDGPHGPDGRVDGATPGADEGVVGREQRDAVLRALQRLPRRQREVLVLRHYLDLPEGEIAGLLGISRGSVKTHAARAAAALRTTLEDER
jgi:RNA polymerase sigma-70 factor (sigma-E family)